MAIAGRPFLGDPKGLLAFGILHADRLVAVRRADLTSLTATALTPQWVSPVFGAALAATTVGAEVYAVSSNTPDVVKMSLRSSALVSQQVPLGPAGVGAPSFGSVYSLNRAIFVSYSVGNYDLLTTLDPVTLRVRNTVSVADPLADYAQSCAIDSHKVLLLESHAADIVNADTLHVLKRVSLAPSPSGVACMRGRAYVSNFDQPSGVLVDSSGTIVGSFRWSGHGSDSLSADPADSVIIGADASSGEIFVCAPSGGLCRTSQTIGSEPTGVVSMGRFVVAVLEGQRGLAVLELATLKVVRDLQLSDVPRLALVFD